MIVGFHVDDIVVVGEDNDIEKFIVELKSIFSIKDGLQMDEFLGTELHWNDDGVLLSQSKIVDKLLKVMREEIKSVREYGTPAAIGDKVNSPKQDEKLMNGIKQVLFRSCIGSLLYLSRFTRPNITNRIRELEKVMTKGTDANYKQLLHLVRYVDSTKNYQVKIIPSDKNDKWILTCYTDSDWAGDEDDRKSVSGWLVKLNGAVICWGSRTQGLTSLSSTEAEYIAVSEVAKEVLFAKTVLEFVRGKEIKLPIVMNCDSTGAIFLSNNQESHRTKYLDTRVHFIRDHVENEVIKLRFVTTDENLADPMTKNLNKKGILEKHPYLTS